MRASFTRSSETDETRDRRLCRRSRLGRRYPGGVRASVPPASHLEPGPLDFPVMYDRIPKGGVEIRRTSDVYSAGGHHLGHVEGFLIDRDEHITHPAAAAAAALDGLEHAADGL